MSTTITGKLRFRFDDGTAVEWSAIEPRTAEEFHAMLDKFTAMDPDARADEADCG